MEKDTNITKVVFLYNEIHEHLFAFFPEEEYHSYPSDMKTSYAHIGQHSGCNSEFAKESRPAIEDEYADLKKELESIGYNLEVVKWAADSLTNEHGLVYYVHATFK